VYANKQDIKGALSHEDIARVLGLHDINQRSV
jgi:signal recognition particle receptor subunit beta